MAGLFFFFLFSCGHPDRADVDSFGYFQTSFYCSDTLSLYNLSLYTRLPANYANHDFKAIVIVTTPTGAQYADTLSLPVIERGVEVKKVESGLWNDYSWIYRKGISLANKGEWNFRIKAESQEKLHSDAVGILVTKR